jgi:hypothetical protein
MFVNKAFRIRGKQLEVEMTKSIFSKEQIRMSEKLPETVEKDGSRYKTAIPAAFALAIICITVGGLRIILDAITSLQDHFQISGWALWMLISGAVLALVGVALLPKR